MQYPHIATDTIAKARGTLSCEGESCKGCGYCLAREHARALMPDLTRRVLVADIKAKNGKA